MRGLMMETPLTLRHVAERAERLFGGREVVSRKATGTERSSYAEAKWWLPDEGRFIDGVPKTSVGKLDKKVLRGRHAAEGAEPSLEGSAT